MNTDLTPHERALARTLSTIADSAPVPDDLAERVLSGRRTGPGADGTLWWRRTVPVRRWVPIAVAAAAVIGIAVATTALVRANRTDPVLPVAPPIAGSTGHTVNPTPASADPDTTAGPTTTVGSTTAAPDPLLPRGDYTPKGMMQWLACDGVPAPEELRLLDPAAEVVAASVCVWEQRYVEGDGVWTFSGAMELPGGPYLRALVDSLLVPDQDPDSRTGCTLQLVVVPNFTLTLADGRRIRPGVPGDGCHPLPVAGLDAAPTEGVTADLPARQDMTEEMVVAGCGPSYRGRDPFTVNDTSVDSMSLEPVSGTIGLCRYEVTPDDPPYYPGSRTATLTTVGTADGRLFDPVVDAVPDSVLDPPPGCTAADIPTPATSYLMVTVPPEPPFSLNALGTAEVAYLEIGGCYRVLGLDGLVAGFAPADAVQALAAAAVQPVTPPEQ